MVLKNKIIMLLMLFMINTSIMQLNSMQLNSRSKPGPVQKYYDPNNDAEIYDPNNDAGIYDKNDYNSDQDRLTPNQDNLEPDQDRLTPNPEQNSTSNKQYYNPDKLNSSLPPRIVFASEPLPENADLLDTYDYNIMINAKSKLTCELDKLLKENANNEQFIRSLTAFLDKSFSSREELKNEEDTINELIQQKKLNNYSYKLLIAYISTLNTCLCSIQ